MRARSAALAILTATACATVPVLSPVPPDGGGWRELRTEHFVLRTDLPPGRARGLLAELEAVVDSLDKGLFRDSRKELSLSVDVVAFEHERDVDLFLPAGAQAIVSPDPRSSRLTIVMKGAFGELQRAVVAHELTHVLMAASFARQPLWFKEGVACYAETIGWEGPDRNVTMGRVPAWRRWSALGPAAAAVRDLLLADRRLDAEQYSLAWGLVHYLMYRQGEAFVSLQERFARGEDPRQAWRATFPRWDPEVAGGPERLRDEVWTYLSAPLEYTQLRARKPEGLPAITERKLTAGDVHDLRVGLPWQNGGRPVPREVFAAELEAALASGSVVAAWIRGESHPAEKLVLAERATRDHPDDARAWLLLAASVTEPARAEAALRRAVGLDPSNAAIRSALARHLVQSGRALEALPHASEAVRLAPWSAWAIETLAAVAYAQGRCPEAVRLQLRAAENIRESDRAGQLEGYLDRLARLEKACGAQRAGASK